ncbi:SNF7 family protein [Aspergillus luchuensis IFO 4308]|nr:SNF7 family protein [Aspergillus luchuensis IFO 4308]
MMTLLQYILSQDSFRKNRLPSLYSDFPIHRKTNPEGYTTNIAAWEHALTSAAKHGYIAPHGPASKGKANHLILRADESLLRDLEIPECGRPVALGAVFDEATRNRTMVPLHLYRTNPASLRKPQWGIDTSVLSPWAVMSWGMKQLKGVVIGGEEATPRLQPQELVLVENLKEVADRVVKNATANSPSKTDLVYSKESFVNEFAGVLDEGSRLSDVDMDVLLLYMSRDSGAIAMLIMLQTIKFRTSDAPKDITEQDTAVASIKTLMATMTKQVENLENKITELNATAKMALQNKNRVSALSAVRSKKLAEHNLKQRLDTLMQLEEVYSKIEQATDQVQFVKVMEASTGALRGLHSQIGGAERVEDVVEELRDEMSKVDEVGNIMNEAGPQIDETEIDDELQELENKEREEMEEKEAEETRKKLAELDSLQQGAQEAARRTAAERAVESELEDRLSRMSVEEGPNTTA